MELKDLAGPHQLSGVDRVNEDTGSRYDGESISFCLDGVTYIVEENPDDGYRSHAEDVMVSGAPTQNRFPPVAVLAIHRETDPREYSGYNADLLEIVNAATGRTILLVGTSNVGDWYPFYVAEYDPTELTDQTIDAERSRHDDDD